MAAKILDGKKLSAEIREELRERIEKLKKKDVTPGLAGILVGDDPGSTAYVGLKEKASGEVGIRSQMVRLAGRIEEQELLNEIELLNSDAKVHGIFMQLPLPAHLNEATALASISPDKDVDGFHPVNVGRAWMGEQAFLPATPVGIYEMLVRNGYGKLNGKHAVIVNVDNLVGKPLASILVQEAKDAGANVTLCHPSTPDLAAYTRVADIVVVSVNRPRFITADMVKSGVIAIDFGANYIEDPSSKTGRRLVGDLDFEEIRLKAEAITPVPGGVGPMTVTMLLANTVTAAERQSTG
jgi:methylenetetrahydrofolate dehydrogenase (NADP+) / methenyltetrahydrofolate cyclohydrolase